MARLCAECGASNPDTDRSCRDCGRTLVPPDRSSSRQAYGSEGGRTGPWLATILIALLVLCCLSLVSLALLDELMPSHPFQTLIVGTPTATATPPPTDTPHPSHTPAPPMSTPEPGADPFEPDDSLAQASPIEPNGARQAHTLSPAGDQDYVSFEVQANERYVVETGSLGAQCDTVLILYDQDGTELARDDDGGEESLASRVGWTASEDGTIFARVSQFDESAEGDDTGYEIWVTMSEPLAVVEDEYEPDGTMEQANEIVLGTPQIHGVHDPEDRDWVFFAGEAGKTYLIETSNLQGGLDTIIFLHDETGQKLAENDDGSPEDQSSRIVWKVESSGMLYVVIQDYYGYEATPEMGYTITVSEGEPYEPDAHEPDDSQDQASVIEVGSYQTHDLHVTGDHDWACFQAVSGTTYVLQTFNLGGRIDTFIGLYDAEGEILTEDDDGGGEALASQCTWRAREDGTLCFMVRDLGDGQVGPGTEYSVALQEEGSSLLAPDRYEPDDTLASAGEIAVGGMQQHNTHAEGDHDWLSFRAEEGVTYLVETSHLGEDIDTIVFLYNEDSEELARDDDGGEEPRASSITWTAHDTGTVYVMARDYKDDRASPNMEYSISVYESYGVPDARAPAIHITDGSYHMVTADTHQFAIGVSQLLSLKNFSLEVDAAQVSGGNDNEYGLVFGYQDDDKYYELAISGDGYAGLFVKERGRWETISAFKASSAVNQGNAVNRLRLEALEGSFSFYVNGQLALLEFDDRFTAGLIGFGCGSFAESGLHCTFDNLRVWDEEVDLVWEDSFDDNSGEWHQSPVR